MGIIVQKYGGTSVGDTDRIKNVAKRIIKSKEKGDKLIVIVSAMAGTTDSLTKLAYEISPNPHKREMDMLLASGEQVSIALLAMALHEAGTDAVSLTANQVGIYTDNAHTKAKIEKIETNKLFEYLDSGKVVIVAGFQGIDLEQNITTLGRGGSDTSAVAIAAAINADLCEIYTDVEGVFSADPRIVPDARKLDKITHFEMLELASLGAKVLHPRSVLFAKRYNVKLVVRSVFTETEGTYIVEETEEMEKVSVSGITSKNDEIKVTIKNVPDEPGMAAKIFGELASNNISVNVIVQSAGKAEDKTNTISFTIAKSDLEQSKEIVENLTNEIGNLEIDFDENISIISIVGIGMRSHSGIASSMFSILAKNGINIQMITTSEIKISVVINREDAEKAVQSLHKEFNMAENVY